MRGDDYLSFDEFNRRSATPLTHTTPAAVGIAVVAGICALFKFLDVLGYPAWFWLRRALHTMALQLVRAVSPAPSLASAASDDSAQSGGMMGSLFGLGASALSAGVRGVASALARGPSDVPPGLGNYDNSCYQNSVIQGLAALPSLRAHLAHTAAPAADTTGAALLDLLARLHDPATRGQHFWIRGKLKSMSTFTQQDAQEYYSRMLDELDREAKKAASSEKEPGSTTPSEPATPESASSESATSDSATATTPPIPLEGSLAQRVGCTTCGYSEGLSLIPFNCITVSLGRRNAYDIRELLDDHTDLEYIEGVECSKCTLLKLQRTLEPVVAKQGADTPFGARLRLVQDALADSDLKDATLIKTLNIPKKNWVKSLKSKQVVVARAPKALVLHVNRSIFDETTFAQYKNNAGVRYPATLDLGKWCLGTAPSRTRHPDLDPKTDEWNRDPNKSMLMDAVGDGLSPFQYRLRAAVTHFGTHGNGHYVCYRPHPRPVKAETDKDGQDAEGEDVEGEDVEGENTEGENVEGENMEDEDVTEVAADVDDEAQDSEEEEQAQPQTDEEQWYRFSDDTVYAISPAEAHQGNVFMLFYERVDPEEPTAQPIDGETAEEAAGAAAPEALVAAPVDVELNTPSSTTPKPDTLATEPAGVAEPSAAKAEPAAEAEPAAHTKTLLKTEAEAEAEAEVPQASAAIPPSPSSTPSKSPSPSPSSSSTAIPPKLSPTTMRTAGKTARNSGSRKSLPLVSAT